jgi:hypothetical protein
MISRVKARVNFCIPFTSRFKTDAFHLTRRSTVECLQWTGAACIRYNYGRKWRGLRR